MIDFETICAISIITTISGLAFRAGRKISSTYQRALLFGLSLVFCATFSWFYAGNLVWANVLPTAGVIHWANFVPIFIAFVVGISSVSVQLQSWRRPLTVSLLSFIGLAYLLVPLARPLLSPVDIAVQSIWSEGVCMQSHESTCGAAAAATLLRMKGVDANEHQMVDACLTSVHGTEPLGLYRGLSVGTRNHEATAKVASANPSLWQDKGQVPCVALVKFDESDHAARVRWLLGPRGEGHAIVVIGLQADGMWSIADPAVGLVSWSNEDLRRRFTGDAIYLGK